MLHGAIFAHGLVFKLLHGLLKHRREAEDPRVEHQLKDYLDLVAMGTVADLMHCMQKIVFYHGLVCVTCANRHWHPRPRRVSGIDGRQEMTSADISLKIAHASTLAVVLPTLLCQSIYFCIRVILTAKRWPSNST